MVTEFYLDDFSNSGKEKLVQYYDGCNTVEDLYDKTNLNEIPVFVREGIGEL